ncbi:hypothetical protein ABZ769_32085 [Streptomyces olivoreticuli]
MFEIRIICDEPDASEITKRLADVFDISDVSRRYPTHHDGKVRFYVVAGPRQCLTHKPAAPAAQEWPDDQNAYEDAPSVIKEIGNVLELSMELNRPGGRTPAAEREQQLRKAALLDRIALDESATFAPDVAANAVETAEAAAVTFALADHATGHRTHGEGPRSPRWAATGHRGYVRQEYARWLTGQ